MTHFTTNQNAGRRNSSSCEARDDWTKAEKGASRCKSYEAVLLASCTLFRVTVVGGGVGRTKHDLQDTACVSEQVTKVPVSFMT